MSSWSKKFTISRQSLEFYLKEYDKVYKRDLKPLKSTKVITDEVMRKVKTSARRLSTTLLKIMAELRFMLEMLNDTDLYRDEYDKIAADEDTYMVDFQELDEVMMEKVRKFGVLRFLKHYQEKYDAFCLPICGRNKLKVNIDEHIIERDENDI